MPRLCPHRTPPPGILSCSEGWPRLQEGRGFMSSLRGAEPSQRKEGRPGAVLGLVWVWVEQNFCGPCSSGAS